MGESLISIGIIIVIVVSIAWLFVPFILMGVNKRLDKLIELQGGEAVSASNDTGNTAKDFYVVAAVIIGLIILAQVFA